MAGPLQPSRNVSAPSPISHVKRTGATGIVDVVNAVDKRSTDSCPALATTILTQIVTTTVATTVTSTVAATNTNSNGNETPSGSAASTWESTTNRPVKTSGPLFDPEFDSKFCLGIQSKDGADWFTASLCAIAVANSAKVKASVKVDTGSVDNAGSATFSVHNVDPLDESHPKDLRAQPVAVNFKDATGPAQDNGPKSWYVGGFRQAIISLGKKVKEDTKDKRDEKDDKADDGKGVVNGELFKNVENSDKEKVAEAGLWGFQYLTGRDVVKEDADKDGKDWGMSSSERELQADKRVDTWMEKVCLNPAIILTNDKPKAKGLKPNMYYTIYSHDTKDKTFQLWSTSGLTPTDNPCIKVPAEDLNASTRVVVKFEFKLVGRLHESYGAAESEESIAYRVDLPSGPLIHLELQNTVAWPGGAERDKIKYAVQDLCGLPNGVGFIDSSHFNLAQVPAESE
nr:hypothetical protein L204_06201 [Cryptococcus depauperatus CBS 7855]